MHLGYNKNVRAFLLLLTINPIIYGQPAKTFRYAFHDVRNLTKVVSSDHSLIIDYSLPEVNLQSIDNENGSFFRIFVPGHVRSMEAGKPEMPVMSRLITIPDGSTYTIKITEVQSTELKPSAKGINGKLYPSQGSEPKDGAQAKRPFVMDKDIYSRREYLKSDTVKIEPLGILRHKRLANIYFYPLRYNPHSGAISAITSMKIEIIFSKNSGSKSNPSIPESRQFSETLKKGVLNYTANDVITGYSDKPAGMIILTDTAFAKLIKPFVTWKKQKGFRVNVLYKGAAYAGDNYVTIQNTLANIYNSATANNPPAEYLLIIGDVTHVPYYNSNGNPTDLYYGEYDGNGDYIPDIFVGRIPAKDTNELKIVLSKIIQYEKYNFSGTNLFSSNALATSGEDEDHQDYMNGQVYYGITNYLNSANKINGYSFYYPACDTAKNSIIKLINNGLSFINYTGHGEASGWLYLNITNSDIPSLTNKNMYPFIISNACYTSQFYNTGSSESFGNMLVTAQDKGAVGYIGCSDESYWDEDYYWSVGVKEVSSQPGYDSVNLGAYDRLFHTHGETPSDWYITMGQVNFAGNLAVSSSTSDLKKYYWEDYNLVGDPSVIPITGTPGTFTVTLPDTLPNGIKSFSFVSDPFSYAAVSHADTLWDAAFASASGSVTLNMPGLSNDSCLFVITGQNRKPVIKTVHFGHIAKEFINLAGTSIADPLGNNDGLADYGETVSLDMTIDNSGGSPANKLYARISSSSEWVTIQNDSVMIGTLAAGAEQKISGMFPMKISDYVPDKEMITINLTLGDSAGSKTYNVDICAHAPSLDITGINIDDSTTGNNNYAADPGETVNLVFDVSNTGSTSTSGQFSVSTTNPDVDIIQPTKSSGDIIAGQITDISIPVKLSDQISIGATVTVDVHLDCDPIYIDKSFTFRVGRIEESFESGSFRIFPWINISPVPWTISSSYHYSGSYSAKSGAISNSQSTTLDIKTFYNQPDSISFWYMVSSEPNYDFLYFRENGTTVFKASGEVPWSMVTVPVPSGYNTLEWTYAKDASVSDGLDCAMIDMIDFAQTGSVKYIARDIYVTRITSPVKKDKLLSEPVTVKLLNTAADTINGFNLAYTINEGYPVSQYFNKQLIPFGDTVTVTFNTPADLSKYGVYDIAAYSYGNNDDYLLNDTARTSIINTDISDPLTICPNPFTDDLKVIINTDSTTTVHISLMSTLGVKVADFEQEINDGRNIIDLGNLKLAPSVYYLKITYPGVNRIIPVVKIR